MNNPSVWPKLSLFFLLLYYGGSNCEGDNHCRGAAVIGFYEERDLELFSSCNHTHHGIFSEKLDSTFTSFGSKRLVTHLKNPLTDIDQLSSRQKQLLGLVQDQQFLTEVREILADISRNQEGLAAFIGHQEDALVSRSLDTFYYQADPLQRLNSSPLALDTLHCAKNMSASIFTPLFELFLVHGASHYLQQFADGHAHDHHHGVSACCPGGLKVPATATRIARYLIRTIQIGHLIAHVANIYPTLMQIKQEKEIVNELHKKVYMAQAALQAIQKLYAVLDRHGYQPAAFGLPDDACQFFAIHNSGNDPFLKFINDQSFARQQSIGFFSRIGSTLTYYRLLKANEVVLKNLVSVVADVDALTAIAHWFVDSNSCKPRACFADFVQNSGAPYVSMNQFWNLAFDAQSAVANDLVFDDGVRSIILTGPNKTGKSSILKAVGLNIILAQTYGIVAAQQMMLTPFDKLISHLLVADDVCSGQSSMVSEMIRADRCLQTIGQLHEGQHACVLIDDSLFKGTTVAKREQLAEQFVFHLGSCERACSIIATHMPSLTTYAAAADSTFANYHIDTSIDSSGLTYSTYRLKPGITDFNAVFDVVQSEGYSLSL